MTLGGTTRHGREEEVGTLWIEDHHKEKWTDIW